MHQWPFCWWMDDLIPTSPSTSMRGNKFCLCDFQWIRLDQIQQALTNSVKPQKFSFKNLKWGWCLWFRSYDSSIINHQPSTIQSSHHPIISPWSNHTSSAPPFTQSTILSTQSASPAISSGTPTSEKSVSWVSIPQEGGQVGEFQGEPKMGKQKRHKSQAVKSLPELIPIHFLHRKFAGFGDGPLEEGMSPMVPTNNSGMPKKKHLDSQFLAAALQSWAVTSKACNKNQTLCIDWAVVTLPFLPGSPYLSHLSLPSTPWPLS